MIFKAVTLLSLAVCVLGEGHAISEQKIVRHHHHGKLDHIGHKEPEHHEEYAPAYPSYEFSYKVEDPHTHDNKGQSEHRDGDEVKGEYWLIEPDGRKRTVKYHSDKHSGYKAIVEYSAPHHHVYHKTHNKHEPKNDEPKHVEHKPMIIEIEHKEIKEEREHPKHIPALSLHAPRYHKYEEGAFHPRDYRRREYY